MFRVPVVANIDTAEAVLRTFEHFDGVASASVHRDLGVHPRAYDLLLVTEHESVEALARFRADPHHVDAAARLAELADSRTSLDHPIDG